MIRKLAEVGEYFRLPGKAYSYTTMKSGNINATYHVTYRRADASLKSYIFQRINTHVFKNPVEIMENIDRVTEHIRARKAPGDVTLHFHHSADGRNYMLDDEDSFWRVMNYVESETYDISEDLSVIYETGVAFGQFQLRLSDFDGSLLHETIPNFHNTKKRLDDLFAAAARNAAGRADVVTEELAYIESVRARAERLSVAFSNGEFPTRVTHNDTKCNNVLFDKKTKPLVVIDLDTVMPGMSMYDFADAARFICSTAVEDEPDTFKVAFDPEKFRALARGYVGTLRENVTPAEIDTLVEASFAITVEIAARFLADYLDGDVYFKTMYPDHNLVRARCQIALAKSISEQWEALEEIIREV